MSDIKFTSLKRPKLYPLTSLRFFAALCVVVLHAANHGLLPQELVQTLDLSKAVAFFFVLSGFVLGYANNGRPVDALRFYKARFARVWPATALSIIFVLLVLPQFIYLPSASSPWPSGFVLLLNLLCLQALFPIPSVYFGFNAVVWSISVEVFFYFCFPLIHNLKTRSLLWITFIYSIFVVLFAYSLSLLDFAGFSAYNLNVPVWEGFIYINPLTRMPEFLMGILLARLVVSNQFTSINITYLRERSRYFYLFDFFEVLLIVLSAWFGFRPYSFSLLVPAQLALDQILSGLSFCVLILTSANSSGLLCQILKWKPLVLLGEVSFGLYLFHQPIMIRSAQLKGLTFGGVQLLPSHFIPVLAWSLAISFASFYFFERPMQAFLRPKRAP